MSDMKVSELLLEVKQLYPDMRPTTYAYWDKAIKPIADLQAHEVTKATARQYRLQSLQSMSTNTVIARIGYLKGIWTKAMHWDLVDTEINPWKHADHGLKKKPRTPEYRPWEFFEAYHEHPWFRILWYTGCRIAEVAALQPDHIVMDDAIPHIKFFHQKNRLLKTDSSVRKVPLHPACFPYVESFKPCKAKSNHGHRWSWTMGKRVGLPPGEAAHVLRHSFHTMCREVGIEEYYIDILTGHAKQSVSAQYGGSQFHILQEQVLKFPHH